MAVSSGVALLAVLVLLADGRQLLETVATVRPSTLVITGILSALSYAAMARSYQEIAAAAGVSLSFSSWFRITLVSNTVNYLVTSAGLSGFAVRMLFLTRAGVPSGRTVMISLVQTFLTNVTLLLFMGIGFGTMLVNGQLRGPSLWVAGLVVAVLAAIMVVSIVLVRDAPRRRATLIRLNVAIPRVMRRWFPARWVPSRARLWRFRHNLDDGLHFVVTRPDRMRAPTAWIMLDWSLAITILWWAFRSVHHPVSPWFALVGFAVSVLFSFVSVIPGGLGVMEGSMTAVFVALGAPFEAAVVAVLIFRVSYHLAPILVSLFLFHGLLGEALHGAAPAPSRVAHD